MNPRIEKAIVEKVHSKGPCSQHIEKGDEITHIAGSYVHELTVGEFVGLASGDIGTSVTLKYARGMLLISR